MTYLQFISNRDPDCELSLPLPPSVNTAYSNVPGRGRVKTKQYREWQNLSEALVLQQSVSPVLGQVGVCYQMSVPDKRVRDCANYEKLSSDLLVRCGIIEDDCNIRINVQQWADWLPKGNMMKISIFSLDDFDLGI